MKKQNKNKVSLNKLTITKINTDTLRKVEGGSSVPTITDKVAGVICDNAH